ncbi:putative DNA-binding transcriptional regulator YafY [Alkalibacillus filiformis]|uniref:DNA-binding transcriptional regulator YafY n=1 Tax=Alkalibacillus filiformis TaxID=200990 RepID=A0ABU0DR79_9BACI|nr:hypothetical protein [Alkalibacillus filiformis]MDQ0350710.1 putative DNA-binding transcriptional regulator YafY [Alkalibacillus filiformis]
MNQLFQKSLQDRRKLEMVYMDSKNNITQRTVRIVKMDDDRILAFCYTKKKVRSFKKENILAIHPVRLTQYEMEA